jgi:hypothetical protein
LIWVKCLLKKPWTEHAYPDAASLPIPAHGKGNNLRAEIERAYPGGFDGGGLFFLPVACEKGRESSR